ncbi:MAG: hypothetical protein ABIY55_27485 [Kofleriaceae bacterium]
MKTLWIAAALAFVGCSKSKAPGTMPGDMTAEQHRTACEEHMKSAAAHEEHGDKLDSDKATYTEGDSHRLATGEHAQAEKHADVARQHGEAAEAVDPSMKDCD